jgi:hypothetical protein
MKSVLCCSLIAALGLAGGCARRQDAPKTAGEAGGNPAATKPSNGSDDAKKAAPIGTATMTEDGTITLNLRAEGPKGTIGDGRLVYRKGDKGYSDVLKHLGGLKPGESKPVPPWPDQP